MKNHTVFIDWKAQQCKDANSPQIVIQIQHNYNQNPSKIYSCKIIDITLKCIWRDKQNS